MKPSSFFSYRAGVLFLLLFSLVFAGCGSSASSPEAVVQKYFRAIADNNVDAVLSCFPLKTVDQKNMPAVRAWAQAGLAAQHAGFKAMGGLKSVKTTIAKQEGNTAFASALITTGNGQTFEQQVILVNEDGWKISIGPVAEMLGL